MASPNPASIIAGTGEMADRIRALDWSQTTLGPIATWPTSLITAVNICINSRFPMVIWWGRADGGSAELRVRDTGTGIAAEELPRLFERFHRVEGAGGRTHEGSGMGWLWCRSW